MRRTSGLVALSALALFIFSATAHALPAPDFSGHRSRHVFPATDASSMVMSRECEPAQEKLIIASVGDVLPQSELSVQAYSSPIGFRSLWSPVIPYLEAANIAYGNLEGPTAQGVSSSGRLTEDPGPRLDQNVYTATNLNFNYHPRILDDLRESGFDIMSVANNHSLDRGRIGLERTITAFEQHGLLYAGAKHMSEPWTHRYTMVSKNGFNVAYIACTQFVNNGQNFSQQMNDCDDDVAAIETSIHALAADPNVDAVIVTPHWGDEYFHIENQTQRRLARRYLDAGATAVIGSHPHVMEPMEKYVTQDGRETVIAYSLGNFISGQGLHIGPKLTAVLYLGLSRRAGSRAWINGVSYVPMWMDRGPNTLRPLEQSHQAPHADVLRALASLFDRTRLLHVGQPIRTDLGCR